MHTSSEPRPISFKHAEMFIGPQTFVEQGTPLADLMEGVLEAMEKAEREFQITSGLLISAHRHRMEQAALELLESIEPWRDRVAGIGMGGAELPHPPSIASLTLHLLTAASA